MANFANRGPGSWSYRHHFLKSRVISAGDVAKGRGKPAVEEHQSPPSFSELDPFLLGQLVGVADSSSVALSVAHGKSCLDVCQSNSPFVVDIVHGKQGADFDGQQGPKLEDIRVQQASSRIEKFICPFFELIGVVLDTDGCDDGEAANRDPFVKLGAVVQTEHCPMMLIDLFDCKDMKQFAARAVEALDTSPHCFCTGEGSEIQVHRVV